MKKGIIITSSVVVGIGALVYLFYKRPKGMITINNDGSGTARLGNKTGDFIKGECVKITTWNQWTLDACSDHRTLRHLGKTMIAGGITKYDGGSSDLIIIHNK
jgi:hypothetical protein